MERLQQESLEPNHNLSWSVFSPLSGHFLPSSVLTGKTFLEPWFLPTKGVIIPSAPEDQEQRFLCLATTAYLCLHLCIWKCLELCFFCHYKNFTKLLALKHRICDKLNLCSLGRGHSYWPQNKLNPFELVESYTFTPTTVRWTILLCPMYLLSQWSADNSWGHMTTDWTFRKDEPK